MNIKPAKADIPKEQILFLARVAADCIVNILFCNRAQNSAKIQLYVGSNQEPESADIIEFDNKIYPSKPYERTGFALVAGESIWVRADIAGVSVRMHGVRS